MSRTAVITVAAGAVIGAVLMGAFGLMLRPYISTNDTLVAMVIFAVVGAFFGGIVYRISVHEARVAEKAGREPAGPGRLALVLFGGIGLYLLAKAFLPAGVVAVLMVIVALLHLFSREE